jgi:hypothetical protein
MFGKHLDHSLRFADLLSDREKSGSLHRPNTFSEKVWLKIKKLILSIVEFLHESD